MYFKYNKDLEIMKSIVINDFVLPDPKVNSMVFHDCKII